MVRLLLTFIPLMISLTVALSWIFHWTKTLTFFASSPPMVFNASLSCLALSLAFLGRFVTRLRSLQSLWLIAFALPVLTGIQYIWAIDFGIDEVFVDGYVRSFLSHPGRMAPITLVCFIVTSLGWRILSLESRRLRLPLALFSLSSFCLVSLLGILGLYAYLSEFYITSGWGTYTKMPILTAICFSMLGPLGIYESWQVVTKEKSSRLQMSGIASGMVVFFFSVLYWQVLYQKDSSEISKALEREMQNRYQQFYQSFQHQAEHLSQMSIPSSRQEAMKTKWEPTLPAVKAVIKAKQKPELIWERGGLEAERDLRLLPEQIIPGSDFRFYPSFHFQRSRWMAFEFGQWLIIFSPQVVIENFFPSEQFLYSLTWNEEVLLSSSSGILTDLNLWEKKIPFRLWDSTLTFQVSPTQSTLNRLEKRTYWPTLWAGIPLSLVVGLIFGFGPELKRRFFH